MKTNATHQFLRTNGAFTDRDAVHTTDVTNQPLIHTHVYVQCIVTARHLHNTIVRLLITRPTDTTAHTNVGYGSTPFHCGTNATHSNTTQYKPRIVHLYSVASERIAAVSPSRRRTTEWRYWISRNVESLVFTIYTIPLWVAIDNKGRGLPLHINGRQTNPWWSTRDTVICYLSTYVRST